MSVETNGRRVHRRPLPPPVSEDMDDEDLGQALLAAVDSRNGVAVFDWNIFTVPKMHYRARGVLTAMRNTNLAAIDRRKLDLAELQQRLANSGDPGGEEYLRAVREFDQWHIRAKSFTRHVDHAMQSLKDVWESRTDSTPDGVSHVATLALRLAAAVDDIVASVGDDELTPEESRAVLVASELRIHLRPSSED